MPVSTNRLSDDCFGKPFTIHSVPFPQVDCLTHAETWPYNGLLIIRVACCLSDWVQEDTSLTFTSPADVSPKQPAERLPKSHSEGNVQNQSSPAAAPRPRAATSVMEASAASDGKGTSVAAVSATTEGADAAEESPRNMVAGLRQLLSEDARVSQVHSHHIRLLCATFTRHITHMTPQAAFITGTISSSA